MTAGRLQTVTLACRGVSPLSSTICPMLTSVIDRSEVRNSAPRCMEYRKQHASDNTAVGGNKNTRQKVPRLFPRGWSIRSIAYLAPANPTDGTGYDVIEKATRQSHITKAIPPHPERCESVSLEAFRDVRHDLHHILVLASLRPARLPFNSGCEGTHTFQTPKLRNTGPPQHKKMYVLSSSRP